MSLQIGRVVLSEGALRSLEEEWSDTGRSVTLSGIQFSTPPSTRSLIAAMHDDILGLPLEIVAVQFDVKDHRNGYYQVASAKSAMIELPGQGVIQLGWEITLLRLGNDQEIDLESRLSGPVNRLNDHSLGGERWHAPSGQHAAYFAGSSTPGEVSRVGSEGAITVYRGLQQTDNPRWLCPVESYHLGRARVYDQGHGERTGTGVDLSPVYWGIDNSLFNFEREASRFRTYSHDGTSWSSFKEWEFTFNGADLGTPLMMSVLHNQYERVTLRLVWDRSPSGRIYLDLTLRRGARYVECLMRSSTAGKMGVRRRTSEASYLASGYVRATSNDASGDRFIVGSRETFTSDLVAGWIEMDSTTRFDFILGAIVNGSSAVAGDTGEDLMAQYIGTPEERIQGVKR